jgi:photosystem II stability/assembly factor-like uncharacterized protein
MLRKLLFAVSVLIGTVISSHGQVEWVHPQPSGFSVVKMLFSDRLNGFILNSNGDLIKTTDQGDSWKLVTNFSSVISMDLKDSTIIIGGYFGILHISDDLGKTWVRKSLAVTDNFDFVDIVNRDTVFLGGSSGKLSRTYDGGNTWKSSFISASITSLDFASGKIGYAGAYSNNILKTIDGGETWQTVLSVSDFPSSTRTLKFLDTETGFAFRDNTDMLSTKDGGKTWKKSELSNYIYALHFIDEKNGFACGESGVIYRTKNAGGNWDFASPKGIYAGYNLTAIYFIDSATGFAAGTRGRIERTRDGGQTWTSFSPHYFDISSLSIPTKTTMYMTTGKVLYKSSDAGLTWNQTTSAFPGNFSQNAVLENSHFFTADTGFVTCSDNAQAFKTYDGGQSWKQVKLINQGGTGYSNVTSLQLLNNKTGYIASTSAFGAGAIFKTVDAGDSWQAIWTSSNGINSFRQIFFIDEKTGYASNGLKLYKTTDSAHTWTAVISQALYNYSLDISSIYFHDTNTGFITAENGLLRKTTDGGASWKEISLGDQFHDDIYRINFMSRQVGFLAAEAGQIFKTYDGGNTWTRETGRFSFYKTNAITIGKDSYAYLAGQNGGIIRVKGSDTKAVLTTTSIRNCDVELTGSIGAWPGRVDSIRVEFSIGESLSFVEYLSFDFVENEEKSFLVKATALMPATVYQARIRYRENGIFEYSDSRDVNTASKPARPVIVTSAAPDFCQGDSIRLTTGIAAAYHWLQNGLPITGANNSEIVVKASGNYAVSIQFGCATGDTSEKFAVTVRPRPAKPTITVTGNQLISSGEIGNQWFHNGIAIVGAVAKQLQADSSGIYAVQVTQNNCKSEFSDNKPVALIPQVVPLAVYPNPAIDQITVPNLSGNEIMLQLSDSRGMIVYTLQTQATNPVINLRNLRPGVYMLYVTHHFTGERTNTKIVKI